MSSHWFSAQCLVIKDKCVEVAFLFLLDHPVQSKHESITIKRPGDLSWEQCTSVAFWFHWVSNQVTFQIARFSAPRTSDQVHFVVLSTLFMQLRIPVPRYDIDVCLVDLNRQLGLPSLLGSSIPNLDCSVSRAGGKYILLSGRPLQIFYWCGMSRKWHRFCFEWWGGFAC